MSTNRNEYMRLWMAKKRAAIRDGTFTPAEKKCTQTNEQRLAQKRAYQKEYRIAHRAERHAWYLAYFATPEGKAVHNRASVKYGVYKRQLVETEPDYVLTDDQWRKIIRLSRGWCYWCKRQMKETTKDHVIPFNKGGLHTASNIIASCRSCNSSKGTKILTLF